MTEKEMLNALQNVWENMTMNKDRKVYEEMLPLLENMQYYLRYDLQIIPAYHTTKIIEGAFEF